MIKSQLDIWEEELNAYPKGVRVSLIVAISIIISFLIWELWIGDISSSVDMLSEQNKRLEKKIDKINLKMYENTIKMLKDKILVAKSENERLKYHLRYLMSASSKYDFLWFDEERFLNILKEILEYSVKLGIRIDNIKTIPLNPNESKTLTGVVKKIKIVGAGNYIDIIKMIYFIESFNVLFEISEIKIWLSNRDNELKFNLLITQYGIKK